MAFDFPASPAADQIFTPPGGPSYIFQLGVWRVYVPGATAYTGDAPPLSPAPGQLWWESDSGDLFIWYDDGNTQQWVQVAGNDMSGIPEAPADGKSYARKNGGWADITATLLANYLPLTGGTLGGDLIIDKANPSFDLRRTAAGQNARILSRMGLLPRWNLILGDLSAESGANVGSDFYLSRYNDAGTLLDSPLSIARADGYVGLNKGAFFQALSTHPAVLDYYGEGAWVPSLGFGTTPASVGMTYTSRAGRFQRVGNTVHWWCYFVLSAKGTSTGIATVAGLPFVAGPNQTWWAGVVGYAAGITGLTIPTVIVQTGTTSVFPHNNGAQMTDALFTNTSYMILSGSYEVA